MGWLIKLIVRIALNGAALWIAQKYVHGFTLSAGLEGLGAGALVLALLNAILVPVARVITAPIRWLTLGLFNIVIMMAVLWIADYLLPQLAIQGIVPLFWTSLIVGLANAFF